MRTVKLAAVVLLAVVLGGCGSAGTLTGNTAPLPAGSSYPVTPSPTPVATVSTACTLGYDGGDSILLPLTAASAAGGYQTAEQVQLTDTSSTGTVVAGFKTETTYDGQVIVSHVITSGYNMPFWLAPGQTFTALVDFSSLDNAVATSVATYLGSECSVVTWFSQLRQM